MTEAIHIFSEKLRTQFLEQVGDPDDFTDVQLKRKAKNFIEKSQEGGMVASDINADDALSELTELLNASKDGIKSDGSKSTSQKKEDKAKIDEVVNELKEKYHYDDVGNKDFVKDNNAIAKLNEALDDGLIEDLSGKGFSKTEIVTILSQTFPESGVKLKNNSPSIPKGHDEEATKIFEKLDTQLKELHSPEYNAALEKINKISANIEANNERLLFLQNEIETLKQEVEEEIEQAIKQSEIIAQEQKDEASSIAKKELAAYKDSKGEITYDQFKSGLATKLDALSSSGSHEMSKVVNKMLDANDKMQTLSKYIGEFGTLSAENKQLAQDLDVANAELEEIEEAEEAEKKSERTDPIGFSANGTKYDFFVDKDNNNKLSNANEFLGADNGWSEMAALDTNGDGKVTSNEMSGLKMVVTDKNGSQQIKNAQDVFGKNDSIDLTSYASQNKMMENGNELLGTYSLNFNGQTIMDGYNTMDENSWLNDNYSFSDNMFANRSGNVEALDFDAEYASFQNQFVDMDGKLNITWGAVGMNQEDVERNIASRTESSAEFKASQIKDEFRKAQQREEQEQLQEEKEAQIAQEQEEEQKAEEERRRKLEEEQE